MSVLILDGHLKSSLSAVRSLGRASVRVVCGSERKFAMACYSKYTSRKFMYTSPKVDQKKFIEEIIQEARKSKEETGETPVVFCFSDATTNTLADAYDTLTEYLILPIPSLQSLRTARNKKATQILAASLSIPTIQTVERGRVVAINFPVVVKNQESILWNEGVAVSGSAAFAFDDDELERLCTTVTEQTGQPPLIQEFVTGEEYGVEMVCKEGEILATFVHKRIRSLSPQGGAAVVKETAAETSEVLLMKRYADALVEKLLWTGPVMVEFKVQKVNGEAREASLHHCEAREGALGYKVNCEAREGALGYKVDNRDSTVLLMEINGRFWGSLPLAVRAGVDFPLIAYRLACGESTGPLQDAFSAPYVRTRHFIGDVLWVCRVLFARDPMRPRLYPSRLRALWEFKTEIFKSKSDTFLWNDSLPSLMEYVSLIRGFLGRYVK